MEDLIFWWDDLPVYVINGHSSDKFVFQNFLNPALLWHESLVVGSKTNQYNTWGLQFSGTKCFDCPAVQTFVSLEWYLELMSHALRYCPQASQRFHTICWRMRESPLLIQIKIGPYYTQNLNVKVRIFKKNQNFMNLKDLPLWS